MNCKPGDIFLYKAAPNSSLKDRFIGGMELIFGIGGQSGTEYDHASILEDSVNQVEAVWPRVRRSAVDWSDKSIEVYRVVGATPEQCAGAVLNAQKRIGEWYDVGEFCFGLFKVKHTEICSQLVEDAWLSQGFEICPKSMRLVAPNDLVASKIIERVY